jgi:heme exporter protein D|tara:strand:+ start:471 stop:698 length:228 start_codon:yes stop_codon:yes gene_type:complete
MIYEIFSMGGHGIYVWSSFSFTFLICLFLYLRTKKTLKKLEKDFIKEAENLPEKQFEDIKKQKIAKEILISHSRG